MASPQKENGYTAIANEVLEKLITYQYPKNTSGCPMALILFVIRKTWGYHKKEDRISLTQFEKAINYPRPTVSHWINYLVKAKLLVVNKEPSNIGYLYSFNKNYDEWIPLVKAKLLVKARKFTSKRALTTGSKVALTHKRNIKENTKETISKDIDKVSYGNSDINWLLQEFQSIMGFKSAGTKDRFMANHLLKNFSKEQITYMLSYCNSNEYAPRIGSVEKLWFKRGDIIAGIKALNIKSNNQREINL